MTVEYDWRAPTLIVLEHGTPPPGGVPDDAVLWWRESGESVSDALERYGGSLPYYGHPYVELRDDGLHMRHDVVIKDIMAGRLVGRGLRGLGFGLVGGVP